MQILSGHVSPDTAYVVDDYPYGFTLRCKIRYWLDCNRTHGVRLMSQTTNPKKAHVWNKPKASTYSRFAGCMYLDEQDHIQWSGMHEYMSTAECLAWMETFGAGIPEQFQAVAAAWVKAKIAYDARRAAAA